MPLVDETKNGCANGNRGERDSEFQGGFEGGGGKRARGGVLLTMEKERCGIGIWTWVDREWMDNPNSTFSKVGEFAIGKIK